MSEIPAGLLLEERAALAMNAVAGLADEDLGGIPFFSANLLDLIGDDGLTYRRTHSRGHWQPNANPIDQRATLLALTTQVVATGDPVAREAADRQVAALKRIAVKERVWAPDGYLTFPEPEPGERITVTFPVAQRSTTEVAAGNEFVTRWRGDDVIGIEPPGRFRPMYGDRREHARGSRNYALHRPESEWVW